MTEFYRYGDSPKDREEALQLIGGGDTYKTYVSNLIDETLPPEPITFEEALIDRLDRIIRLLQRQPRIVDQTINQRHIVEEIQQRIAAEAARWSAYSKESAAVIAQRQEEEADRGQNA